MLSRIGSRATFGLAAISLGNSIDNLIVLGENNDKVNLIGVGEYVFYNLHNE